MSLPSDIPPIPAPPPLVTVPQSLFERMAAVYWGTRGGPPTEEMVVPAEETAPTVFDPDRAGAIVFPDVHPGWRPVGRNAPKAPKDSKVEEVASG